MPNIIFIIIAAVVFTYLGYFLRRIIAEKKVKDAETKAKEILEDAKKTAQDRRREVELDIKDQLLHMRQDFEQQTKDRRREIAELEKRLTVKEENLDRRVDLLEKKEKELEVKSETVKRYEDNIKAKEAQLTNLIAEEKLRLEKISSLSPEEAKQILLTRLTEELNNEKSVFIKRMEDEVRGVSEKKSREIISLAIERCAAEHTVESTISVVNLPNDEMKGRVIGREGRNIRALEMATGVDVIIDDTPEAVTLSAFDTVRREIARLALEKLIADGRIHPGRIEEIVEKMKKEMSDESQMSKLRSVGSKAQYPVYPLRRPVENSGLAGVLVSVYLRLVRMLCRAGLHPDRIIILRAEFYEFVREYLFSSSSDDLNILS